MPTYVDKDCADVNVEQLDKDEQRVYEDVKTRLFLRRKCFRCLDPFDIAHSSGIYCRQELDHYDPQTEQGDLRIPYKIYLYLQKKGFLYAPGWKKIIFIEDPSTGEPCEVVLPRFKE